ncbi:DNA ligase 6 isoform X2 [Aristolochia californica]
MDTPEVPISSATTWTISTSDLFVSSFISFSRQFPNVSPPLSFSLLSQKTPLPAIPPKFPRSKLIPGTRFVVDGFKNAGTFSVSYFLSHFHSDHYTGLNSSWSKGLIFCSITTASLLIESLKISNHFVAPLSLGETVIVDGCEVTLVDANHCPGAVQFLFKVPAKDGRDERYVHTGDFRYCESMKLQPALRQFVGCDAVFLDTTYCNPKFVFPSQDESIDYIVSTISRTKTENEALKAPVLFLVATYVVGKERILLEISRKCNCLVHVDHKKMAILRALGYSDSGIFTEDASSSCIHVIGWNLLGESWPYFRPNFVKMKEIVLERGYSKAVGFVPSGWTYDAKKDGFAVKTKGLLEIHLVPYSEHSSYLELKDYVRFLRPKSVVPTVGLDIEKLDSKHVIAMKKHFTGLVDEMGCKHEFLMGFYSRPCNSDRMDSQGNVIGSCKEREAQAENNLQFEFSKANLVLDLDAVLSSAAQGTVEETSSIENGKDVDGAAEKLRDCLPFWVTQDQISDLLSRSRGEIAEAVSDFYEHETELYEQVKAPKDETISCQEVVCFSRSASNIEVVSSKSILIGESIISQGEKSCNTSFPISSTFSPKKKGARLDNKPKKKTRSRSAVDYSGSKQSTITKFFSKVVPKASQADELCSSTAKQCLDEQNLLYDEVPESYKEQLDHFTQILNGSISRDQAAMIIKEAKGDINLALDMYYTNSNCNFDHVDEKSSPSTSAQIQEDVSCYSAREASIGVSTVELSKGDQNETLVALSVEKYYPIEHACWMTDQPAPYLHLARTFDLVEKERGKIKAVGMLTNMFRSLLALSPRDVLPAVYLCTNKIAADHENLELNIGGSLVSSSIEEACGTNKSNIREMYYNLGDLGDVAQVCRQTQSLLVTPRPLLIRDVFSVLRKISLEVGSGSTTRKKNLIVNLMRSCREMEIKFLVRTLVRNLRIGAMMRTVLPALAQATVLNSSSHVLLEGAFERLKPLLQSISAAVVEAYSILPNLDLLVPSLLSNSVNFCSTTLSVTPGIPIQPMLARITNGIDQALKVFHGRAFTCEYKYDGQCAQIHKLEDGRVQVFSRSGEEATSKFPDVVNIIKESCNPAAKTFILDAEVVAVDRKNDNKLLCFQQLSSRERGGRDSLITLDNIKVDICVFIFDIMFTNGKQLLISPLRERRKYLKGLFHEEKFGCLEFAKEITVEADESFPTADATLTKVNSFLENAFNSSCEGILVKSLDINAGYAASKRTDSWLKV